MSCLSSRFTLLTFALAAAACGHEPTSQSRGAIAEAAGQAALSVAAAHQTSVTVCHRTGSGWHQLDVAQPAWPAHRGHGDYALAWTVDPAGTGGDGRNFTRIADAIKAADSTRRVNGERVTANCRITIAVVAGTFHGGWLASSPSPERLPFVIAVPDVTLQGAAETAIDADGRATANATGAETVLEPDGGVVTPELLVVVSTDAAGFRGDGVTISGFRFSAGINTVNGSNGVTGIGAQRVGRLVISGNRFEGDLNGALDFHGVSARVERNFAAGHDGCGFCLNGPGEYDVTANRLEDGGFAGVFLAPIAIAPAFRLGTNPLGVSLPADDPAAIPRVFGTVSNNAIVHYQRQPKGLGSAVRIVTFAREDLGADQSGTVTVTGNRFEANTFNVSVDANLLPGDAVPTGHAAARVDLRANVSVQPCRAQLLVSFTRLALPLGAQTGNPYLQGSTYRVTGDSSVLWSAAWVDDPPSHGNTLLWNGQPQDFGNSVPLTKPPATC